MKNVFYILIFFTFAGFSVAKAADNLNFRCQPFVLKPKVTIKAVFEPLKYNYSKVSRTLERMQKEEMNGQLVEGYKVNGLTPYKLETNLMFTLGKKVFNDGVTCFFPTEVNLTLTFKDPVIYIARQIKEGTCAYQVTLRHEQTHEQINVEAFEHYLPLIKDQFIAAVKKYSLMSRPKDDIKTDIVKDSLTKKYLGAINPLLDELSEEINMEQSKLDRIEQYDYEQSLCL